MFSMCKNSRTSHIRAKSTPKVMLTCELCVFLYRLQDEAVVLYADAPDQLYRFCNQCFKFEPLQVFDGAKK
jgi:hypothetical protein